MDINKLFKEYKTILIPKTRIAFVYILFVNIQVEKIGAKIINIGPKIMEQ